MLIEQCKVHPEGDASGEVMRMSNLEVNPLGGINLLKFHANLLLTLLDFNVGKMEILANGFYGCTKNIIVKYHRNMCLCHTL